MHTTQILNIHNLLEVHIEAHADSTSGASVLHWFSKRFPRFQATDGPQRAPAIRIQPAARPLLEAISPDPGQLQVARLFRFYPAQVAGRPAMVSLHQNRTVRAILAWRDDGFDIYYADHRRAARVCHPLFLLALRMTLGQRGGDLLHCAALTKRGRNLLICGHRGAKKTLLTLALLQQGWDFVTEDKALLLDGKVWLFEPRIEGVKKHHVDLLPELKMLDMIARRYRKMNQANWIRNRLYRVLPDWMFTAMDRRMTPSVSVAAFHIRADVQLVDSIQPDTIAFLQTGSDFAIENISLDSAMDTLAMTQSMLFDPHQAMEELTWMYGPGPVPDYRKNHRDNLHPDTCKRIVLPHDDNLMSHLQEVCACFE